MEGLLSSLTSSSSSAAAGEEQGAASSSAEEEDSYFPETMSYLNRIYDAALPETRASPGLGGEDEAMSRSLSVKEMQRIIALAGLSHVDCLERSDLEVRTGEAQRKLEAEEETKVETIGGLKCCVLGALENPELVVVIFHGYLAPAAELTPLAFVLEQRLREIGHRVMFVMPQAPANGSWFSLNFSQYVFAIMQGEAEKARVVRATPDGVPALRVLARAFVSALCARTNLPTKAVCLAGFSQGAMVAVDVALELEETVAGVVVMSGFVMAVEHWARRLATFHRGLRVLQLHGLQDNTIPFYTAPWLCELLKTNGAKTMFIPHSGGHDFGPPHVFSSLLSFLVSLVQGAPVSAVKKPETDLKR